MASETNRASLPGSERQPLPNAQVVGPADPNERIEVTVIVRPRASGSPAISPDELGARMPRERQHLSREDFAAAYGADPADLTRVADFARSQNLQVLETNAARRIVRLASTVAAFNAAFGVQLQRYEADGISYRGRVGPIQVPADLVPVIQAVMGLDDRPQAGPHVCVHVISAAVANVSFTPVQVANLYNFPSSGNGQGQCIGIVELGGGFQASEVQTYFSQLGLTAPSVAAVPVDGGTNSPGVDTNADTEVLLDIEVAGTVAPGAKIVVYFAPNTDSGFLDAITTAVHDTTNKPSVISISWGGPESTWTTQALQSFNQAFQDAATLGVTVCCSSGDSGSSDGVNDGLAHVDFPASSPYALACGGTSVQVSGNAVTQEVVWNDSSGASGGGISDFFPLPSWQSAAIIPPSANPNKKVGRGLPDVSGDADPATGYSILADGKRITVGGTSAVSPLWAGLIALINQQLNQPVGFLNPLLYNQLMGTGALRDITSGNNGIYQAQTGWDACTGFGSPDGAKLLQALSQGTVTQPGPTPSPSPSPVPTPTPTPQPPPPPDTTGQGGGLGDLILGFLRFLASLLKSIFGG